MRLAVGIFAAAVTALVGNAAASAADLDADDVEVKVKIGPLSSDGTLAMTIAGTSEELLEDGTDAIRRQFKGTLPTVTVTDDRDPDDVDPDAFWAVMGVATDFVGDAAQPNIPAANFGWSPDIVGDDADGMVVVGGDVATAIDNPSNAGLGYAPRELLFMADNSADLIGEGETWQASADLILHTPLNVAQGEYTSQLTLTLME
jgi:hypothetical protein